MLQKRFSLRKNPYDNGSPLTQAEKKGVPCMEEPQ